MVCRSLGAVSGPPLLRPTLAGVECGVSARSKPALDWNVACACVLSPLVTPGGDVDGSRPRPRARGTLPLGTARSGPSSLPRAQAEAGPGRGRSRAGLGPGSGHLPGGAFALRRRSRAHLSVLAHLIPFITKLPEEPLYPLSHGLTNPS